MTEEAKVEGKTGFDKEPEKEKKQDTEDMITKEESMFRIDKEGKAIPEKYPIYIYDRNIDEELINEGLQLMQVIKRQKALNKAVADEQAKLDIEINALKPKIETEKDEKIKKELIRELTEKQNMKNRTSVDANINSNVVDEGIRESREILTELKKEKEKQTVKKFVELTPCMCSEAVLAFEKGRTIDNKPTDDWVADLISKKITNPSYTIEEAKKLRPDYKIALKDAVMSVSSYKTKNYREIMAEVKLAEERPKTLKKD
ncbi:MAG: hypothetical protein U9O94_10145 [Nanoarchaeota archaeon]|nr:hypothetical protein [Nanoarchaeota archaeon]